MPTLSKGCVATPMLSSGLCGHAHSHSLASPVQGLYGHAQFSPHLPQRHMLETSTTQIEDRLDQGEGSEAIEGCPGPHILFISFNNGSTQSV